MKSNNIENKAQALEYLRYVSLNWKMWEKHHNRLMQAIRIILASVKEDTEKMKFYFDSKDGKSKKLTEAEAREHLSACQIAEAIAAKRADPAEEVSYMTVGGFIRIEL